MEAEKREFDQTYIDKVHHSKLDVKYDEILFCSFNQNQGCFACGTQEGFRIYNSFPFKDSHKRSKYFYGHSLTCVEFDGGIGIVEMMYRTNILALVGGGSKPKFPSNKVFIWDDQGYKCIGELSFKSTVKAVRMTQDK